MESLVLSCLEEKTDARIEYASDEEKRHIKEPQTMFAVCANQKIRRSVKMGVQHS